MLKEIKYYLSLSLFTLPVFILALFVQLRLLALIFILPWYAFLLGLSVDDTEKKIKFELLLEDDKDKI